MILYHLSTPPGAWYFLTCLYVQNILIRSSASTTSRHASEQRRDRRSGRSSEAPSSVSSFRQPTPLERECIAFLAVQRARAAIRDVREWMARAEKDTDHGPLPEALKEIEDVIELLKEPYEP